MNQEIYWVVGPGTNAGKTTIASAAISVLCELGYKTIGFKPYSARKFVDVIDSGYPGYPKTISRVAGLDGAKLATISSITSPEDIDLISPVVYICYPEYLNTLVVRAGSQKARNAEFFKGDSAISLENRKDYKRILKDLEIGNWVDFQKTTLNFLDSPVIGGNKVEGCFQYLINSREVDAVVCEGAGRFLPFWNELKLVNHVFFIGNNEIYFFRDVDLKLNLNANKLLPVTSLSNALRQKKSYKAFLPFSRSEKRDDVAMETMRRLLQISSDPAIFN